MALNDILNKIKQIEGLPSNDVADLVAEVAILAKSKEDLEGKLTQTTDRVKALDKQLADVSARYKDLPDPEVIKGLQESSSKYQDIDIEALQASAEELASLKDQYGKEVSEMQAKLQETQATARNKDSEYSKITAMFDKLQDSYTKTQADLAAIREEKEKERLRANRIQAETALSNALDAVNVDKRRKAGAEALFKLQGLELTHDESGKDIIMIGDQDLNTVINDWASSEDGKAYIRQKHSTGGESSNSMNSGSAKPSSAVDEDTYYYRDPDNNKVVNYTKVAAGLADNDQTALSVARREGILVDAATATVY